MLITQGDAVMGVLTGRVGRVHHTQSGWSYIVQGPAGSGFAHQPSKLWRSKGMAVAALRRCIKRYEEA